MSHSLQIPLSGLSCASCVRRAETALNTVSGVSDVSVNLATHTARVTLQDTPLRDVATALETAGYPAKTRQIRLSVQDLTDSAASAPVVAALRAVPSVLDASVNLATQTAQVTALSHTDSAVLVRAIADAGYKARDLGQETPEMPDQILRLRRLTLIAAALTLPVFILEMGGHLFPPFHHWIMQTIGMTASWTVQFILTSALLLGPGRVFFGPGLKSLKRGTPDMNALVVLGSMAAYTYSVLALFVPSVFPQGTRAVFFEAACVIITLILFGRWLESRAKGRTGSAIARLAGLRPATALVIRDDAPIDVPLAEIVVGDALLARPGSQIAVDGVVVEGTSWIDESMLTGEPEPAAKAAGDPVTAGTINATGALTYRATAVGDDTILAQMIDMVGAAQGAKLPVQDMVDRITAVFVPIVIGIAILTALVWMAIGPGPTWALVAAVSVLIIACPCAMGLATPTSITVGMGRAADSGVLFRKGTAMQELAGVRTVAFDKTGTLTAGKPALTSFKGHNGWSQETVLPLIAAAERASEHPIARAIVDAAGEVALPAVTDAQAVPGKGILATVDGHDLMIGSARFMAEHGITTSTTTAPQETPIYAAVDGKLAASIGVSDPIKPDTPAALQMLKDRGLTLAMITGDATTTANAIAAELGITEIRAEVLPGEKATALADLPGPIVFVGDGINDAPALATADVGVAVGTGTDIAIEAADVVLMSGDLGGVARAIAISRATMKNIRQNLFWAFAYNVALIPVAAGILYPAFGLLLSPMLAAGAMALSSVFVVSNALRLKTVGSSSE